MMRAPAPLLVKHRPSRTMTCPSEAADRKQNQPLGHGAPRRTRSSGTAAWGLQEPREASKPDPEAGEQSGEVSWRRRDGSEIQS